jgi:hypothetical protein
MGEAGAARHVPQYAKALMAGYAEEMKELRRVGGSSSSSGAQDGAQGVAAGGTGAPASMRTDLDAWSVFFRELLLL